MRYSAEELAILGVLKMILTTDQLQQIMPRCDIKKWVSPLNMTMRTYSIDLTPQRMAAFLAQVAHESAECTRVVENLSYSTPERICAVWPNRFPTVESARVYVKNPELLANKVYGGRMGNDAIGDGWKFRGRGLFQITGKENYLAAGKALSLPIIYHPQYVEQPNVAALTAAWFWDKCGLNYQANQDTDNSFEAITRKINGGNNGMRERKMYWEWAKKVLYG